jgi:hypothetical protein
VPTTVHASSVSPTSAYSRATQPAGTLGGARRGPRPAPAATGLERRPPPLQVLQRFGVAAGGHPQHDDPVDHVAGGVEQQRPVRESHHVLPPTLEHRDRAVQRGGGGLRAVHGEQRLGARCQGRHERHGVCAGREVGDDGIQHRGGARGVASEQQQGVRLPGFRLEPRQRLGGNLAERRAHLADVLRRRATVAECGRDARSG